MKKILFLFSFVTLFFLSAIKAQDEQPATPAQETTDASATDTSKLIPMPEPLTIEKIYPVIGTYQSAGSEQDGPMKISVMVDENNKGVAWISGLPQGKVKALLLKSPATYKIPVQKTEEGNDVAEGTLIYDQDTRALSLCLGCTYNYQDPSSAFAISDESNAKASKKDAKKHWVFVGTKLEQSTATSSY